MQILYSNRQYISGLSNEQKSKLKEKLTFNNPKYAQAKRYGRSRYISIPPYLTYYEDKKDYFSVPIGVDVIGTLNTEECSLIGDTIAGRVSYPEIKIELREDQQKAFDGFCQYKRPNFPYPNHTGVIQLPTGKGKSILGIYMSYYFKQKTLILVHKDDLVTGWQKDLKLCFGEDIDIGLIKAKSRKIGSQFTIATVQTLGKMSDEELSQYTNYFGMVIQDEVHHCGANYFNIIDKFKAYYKIGLSATPKRTDGLNYVFNIFFGGIVYKHQYDKNTDKDILPVKVIVQESKAKFKPFIVQNSNGIYSTDQFFNSYDYKESEMPKHFRFVDSIDYNERPRIPFLVTDNEVVLSRQYKIQVCKDIIHNVRQGHSCLALFTQKEHINAYYNYLRRFIPEDKIMKYYGDSKEKSEVLMNKAESKEVLVTLGTLAKATEGTNVKAWEVLFLVSSINNEKNTEQATGRIRRTKQGKLNPVLVYDYTQPNVYGMSSHFSTRKSVYKNLEYTINFRCNDPTNNKFSKGFRKR